jgi:hypothetical protein
MQVFRTQPVVKKLTFRNKNAYKLFAEWSDLGSAYVTMKSQLAGKSDPCRPLMRLLDYYTETKTGHGGLIPWEHNVDDTFIVGFALSNIVNFWITMILCDFC